MNTRLIIVAGFSSAGKSTFISSNLLPDLQQEGINTEDDVEILFAGKLLDNFDLGNKAVCIIHYNLLLQFDANPQLQDIDLSTELVFCELLKHCSASTVYLCYTPDNVLLERINNRKQIEPAIAPSEHPYPSAQILKNVEKVNQRQLLLECGEGFMQAGADIQVVFSGGNNTSLISWDDFKYAIPNAALEAAIT